VNVFFPTTIVDGFFDNPDPVVDFARSLEYFPDEEGRWPGVRSKPLHEVNPDFFNFFINRKMALFYALDKEYVSWNVNSYFQIVPPDNKKGWTHRDGNLCTSIVYLSKNLPLDCGTSICRLKPDQIDSSIINAEHKINGIKNNLDYSTEKIKQEENNSKFEDIISVSNVYNRLLMFDASLPHRAQNFYGCEDRLTLVSFIKYISAQHLPIPRMKTL
jgi:hypothetical protein